MFAFNFNLKLYIMKKILLSLLFLSSLMANAQTTIFEDSFETYADFAITGVGSWALIDVDLRPTYVFPEGIGLQMRVQLNLFKFLILPLHLRL